MPDWQLIKWVTSYLYDRQLLPLVVVEIIFTAHLLRKRIESFHYTARWHNGPRPGSVSLSSQTDIDKWNWSDCHIKHSCLLQTWQNTALWTRQAKRSPSLYRNEHLLKYVMPANISMEETDWHFLMNSSDIIHSKFHSQAMTIHTYHFHTGYWSRRNSGLSGHTGRLYNQGDTCIWSQLSSVCWQLHI